MPPVISALDDLPDFAAFLAGFVAGAAFTGAGFVVFGATAFGAGFATFAAGLATACLVAGFFAGVFLLGIDLATVTFLAADGFFATDGFLALGLRRLDVARADDFARGLDAFVDDFAIGLRAAGFFATAVFFTGLAGDFFATGFALAFTADLATGFFATVFFVGATFAFTTGFLAAGFFATVFLTTGFADFATGFLTGFLLAIHAPLPSCPIEARNYA
jgi:hypothetical protein